MRFFSTAIVGLLLIASTAFGQFPNCSCGPPCPCPSRSKVTQASYVVPASYTQATPTALFAWRDTVHQRLQKLEGQRQASPQSNDQTATIQMLQMQILMLNNQIAQMQGQQQRPNGTAPPPIQYHIYNPAPQGQLQPTPPQQILQPAPPQQQLIPAPPQQILQPAPPQQQLIPAPPGQNLKPAPPQQQLIPAPPAPLTPQVQPGAPLTPQVPGNPLGYQTLTAQRTVWRPLYP